MADLDLTGFDLEIVHPLQHQPGDLMLLPYDPQVPIPSGWTLDSQGACLYRQATGSETSWPLPLVMRLRGRRDVDRGARADELRKLAAKYATASELPQDGRVPWGDVQELAATVGMEAVMEEQELRCERIPGDE